MGIVFGFFCFKSNMKPKTKYIVYIGSFPLAGIDQLIDYIRRKKKNWKIVLWRATELDSPAPEENKYLEIRHVDYSDKKSMQVVIDEYKDRVACVTFRSDSNIRFFQKIIPLLPKHLRVPTVSALRKGDDKVAMRRAFSKYSKRITPKYEVIENLLTAKPSQFKTKLHFPVIVKPNGLQGAFLVQAAYYGEELKEILVRMKKRINKVYASYAGRGNASVLIEEIIEGDQYSVDVYIDDAGEIYYCPFVKYKMAADKGFDDFFSYEQTTPATISKESIEKAKEVCELGIDAMGLRNSSAHIELIRREGEWKIVEIGPRLGGFRPEMYKLSFGFNHSVNDLLNKMGKKPIIKRKRLGYTSAIKFYPREEGYITKISGIKKAKELKSFKSMTVKRKKGRRALHAKHGDRYVVRVTLFNKNKAQFIKDRRKLEQMIKITTVKTKPKK